MAFLPDYKYFIAISFFLSLIVFFHPRDNFRYLRLFSPFLLLTFAAETIGTYLYSKGKNNLALYNFFSVFEFCFYLWIMSVVIINPKVRNVIRITAVTYGVISILNILFIQGMNSFHTVTYSVGCLLIVIFCIYFFYEIFKLPKSIKLKNNPTFWICSGLLFFYCCGFPVYAMVNFWRGVSKLFIQYFDQIFTILNIFLYSLFSIAFICRIRIRKYIS